MTHFVFLCRKKHRCKRLTNIDWACVCAQATPRTKCYTLCRKCNICTGTVSKSRRRKGKKSLRNRYPKSTVEMTQLVFLCFERERCKRLTNIDRACVCAHATPRTKCYTLCRKCNICTGTVSKSRRRKGKKSLRNRYPKSTVEMTQLVFFVFRKREV